jgi:Sulfotransferase domain
MQYQGKIFGLGFHKTGTSSLASALRKLGYHTIHGDPRGSWSGADEGLTLTKLIDSGKFQLPTFGLFDAFVDNPYFSIWLKLVDIFPDAKFILTLRDDTAWIESCINYYAGRRVRPMRAWMFGTHADPASSREARNIWLDRYRQHNDAVQAYFSGDNERLLTLNLCEGDGWTRICNFLRAPRPERPFPHANKLPAASSEEFK